MTENNASPTTHLWLPAPPLQGREAGRGEDPEGQRRQQRGYAWGDAERGQPHAAAGQPLHRPHDRHLRVGVPHAGHGAGRTGPAQQVPPEEQAGLIPFFPFVHLIWFKDEFKCVFVPSSFHHSLKGTYTTRCECD